MTEYRRVLIAALLVLFACLGLGRFGFGIILPNMQENLAISTTAAGFIGTANFIGYLVGIFLVGHLYQKFAADKLISSALILQAISMFLMAMSNHYLIASWFYAMAGFCSATANVSIMVYVAHVIPQHLRGKALGIIIIGNGLGIIFSGIFVPQIEALFSENAWRVSWGIFALLTIIIAILIKPGLRQHDNKVDKEKLKLSEILSHSAFWKISSIYFIFGLTYVIYLTFFVSAAIDKYQLSIQQSGYFWLWLGFMSLLSGPFFGSLADKIGAYKTLILIFSLLSIAYLILVMQVPSVMLLVSVTLFGLAAWVIPSLVTLLTSLEYGKEKTAQVFSMVTVIFAIGQMLGPIAAGYIFDSTSSFNLVFLICTLLALAGIALSSIFHAHITKNSSE